MESAAGQQEAGRIRAELRRLAAESGRDPDRLRVFADLTVDLGGGERGPEPGAEVALVPDADDRVLFRGGPVDLAGLIAEWQRSGAADGFHVRPVRLRRGLERFVNGTTTLLQHRGLFRSFHPGATLREHLGLHRPAPTSPPCPAGRPADGPSPGRASGLTGRRTPTADGRGSAGGTTGRFRSSGEGMIVMNTDRPAGPVPDAVTGPFAPSSRRRPIGVEAGRCGVSAQLRRAHAGVHRGPEDCCAGRFGPKGALV